MGLPLHGAVGFECQSPEQEVVAWHLDNGECCFEGPPLPAFNAKVWDLEFRLVPNSWSDLGVRLGTKPPPVQSSLLFGCP